MSQEEARHGGRLDPRSVSTLRAQVHGRLIGPDDEAYEQARKVWNGMIDKHPALILRAADVDDIVAGVRFARERGLLLSARGGAHSVAGYGTNDGGLVLDLGLMKRMEVDPGRRIARAQPGLRWGEFDRATQEHGLATPGGAVSDTGIAGLTLGGGLGWLSRQYGLTCDNLLAVEVVTAEGQVVRASDDENQDLFWAMRGAGANFGIASRFEYRLHPVGPLILAGALVHPASRASQILDLYREFTRQAPTELITAVSVGTASPGPNTPPDIAGRPVVTIVVFYGGDIQAGERAIQPLRAFAPPVMDSVQPMPYVAWQSAHDDDSPTGGRYYWKSAYVQDLSPALVDQLLQRIDQIPGPMSGVAITQMEGAIKRVPEEATAFGHRDARFTWDISMAWLDPAENERNIAWAREFYAAVEPFTRGAYVNFLGAEGQQRVIDAYGRAKYERLVELKRKWDPDNVFRSNQNIKPKMDG